MVIVDELPAGPTWVLPPECAFDPAEPIARCELGDLAGGATVDLEFTATLAADECGTFVNVVAAFVEDDPDPTSSDVAAVDVPCPPEPPPDPLILLTKEPSATSVVVPGTITYRITFENAGPGVATNVTASDELPAGAEWSLGSGSNVCSIDGKTLTCFAETVPDGVFEVLELIGEVDGSVCGTMENQGTVAFEGGPEPGSVTAVAEPVEVAGCEAVAPSATARPSEDAGAGGQGDLPDTSTPAPTPIGLIAAAMAMLLSASALVIGHLRTRTDG